MVICIFITRLPYVVLLSGNELIQMKKENKILYWFIGTFLLPPLAWPLSAWYFNVWNTEEMFTILFRFNIPVFKVDAKEKESNANEPEMQIENPKVEDKKSLTGCEIDLTDKDINDDSDYESF